MCGYGCVLGLCTCLLGTWVVLCSPECSPLLGPLFSSLFSTGLSLRSPTVLVSTSLRAPVIRHRSVDRHVRGLVAEVWWQSHSHQQRHLQRHRHQAGESEREAGGEMERERQATRAPHTSAPHAEPDIRYLYSMRPARKGAVGLAGLEDIALAGL